MLADTAIERHLMPLVDAGVGMEIRPVPMPGEDHVIGWKVSRHPTLIQKDLISVRTVPEDWLWAWHGTKPHALQSIFETNLRPSGSTGVKPPEGHIPLGVEVFGIKDFARAVFVSPDLTYSAHPAYAGRIAAGGQEWPSLILARVRPESFLTIRSTVSGYVPLGESVDPEWRVATELEGHFTPTDLDGHPSCMEADLFRIADGTDAHAHVVVTDAILVAKNFIDSCIGLGLSRNEITELFVKA